MNKTEMQIQTILEACSEKKGYAFSVIDISKITTFADYFIICSVNNERQAEAVAEEVLKRMSEIGIHAMNKEGFNTKKWILLDYGDIIVHIFHKDERKIYKLEQLWADGNEVNIEKYGIENWL